MSYATVSQLRARLTQIEAGATNDALLQECLDEATEMIDLELGFSLAAYGAAAAKDVRTPTYITDTWTIPAHETATPSTVTTVLRVYSKGTTSVSTETVTDWTELEDGSLYRYSGWDADAWYRVTAKWGHDEPSTAIQKVCWEKAKDVWFSRYGSASSNSVGIEGAGGVPVQRTWSDEQWRILQRTRQQHSEFGIA